MKYKYFSLSNSGSKKEAAESEASTSGQSTARSDKTTQQMGKLTLDDKPKQQPQQPKQGGPSTSGQAPQQQKQGGPPTSGRAQQQQQQPKGQQESARGGPQQQQQKQQGGQQPHARESARGPGQQQQQPAQSGQSRPEASAWQQRPAQGQQQSARGPQQQQAQGQQQQQPARGPQQQRPAQGAQQPQASVWTQRPAQGSEPPKAATGPSGPRPQQRSAPVARPAHGKGDQKTHTPKPAIISYDYKICEYKGPGKLGRPVKIETNYLKLDVSKLVPHAFHYDISIDFEPVGRTQPGKKFMHPVFAAFAKQNFKTASLAYDGQKNAYAPQKLDLSKAYNPVVEILDEETGQKRVFKVEIKEVKGSFIDLSVLKE